MGGEYDVTLTKPFYIGVFEVTQRQYELVVGKNPAKHKGGTRPVEQVSWDMVRGDSKKFNWPDSCEVEPSSFIGRIRSRTGIVSFDLPTEAQWEYACRAGTTSNYNNGGDSDGDLKLFGRYHDNQTDGKGGYSQTTTVGSYLPNAWGLYDMYGNVSEWCLDRSGRLSNGGTDPVGPSTGAKRLRRGGSWITYRRDLGLRRGGPSNFSMHALGFRLARTLSE